MKINVTIWIFYILLFASCSRKVNTRTIQSDKEAKMEIRKVMAMQEEAWSNGDIDAFMKGYWQSEELTFIGKSGLTYGWQTTLDNYKKGYSSPEIMGTLKFDVLELQRISEDTYHMIGRYALIRKADRPTGYFSLLWKYIDGEWKIISDHTSG